MTMVCRGAGPGPGGGHEGEGDDEGVSSMVSETRGEIGGLVGSKARMGSQLSRGSDVGLRGTGHRSGVGAEEGELGLGWSGNGREIEKCCGLTQCRGGDEV